MSLTTTTPVLAAADEIQRMLLGVILLDAIGLVLARAQATDCPACRARSCLTHRPVEKAWRVLQAAFDELAAGEGAGVLSPAASAAVRLALPIAAAGRCSGREPLDAALSAAYGTLAGRLGQVRS